MYRVQLADEWTVLFTEAMPIGNRPTQFMLHRTRHTTWQFHFVDGWGDHVPCSHIVAAYEWCKSKLGDDFAQERSVAK